MTLSMRMALPCVALVVLMGGAGLYLFGRSETLHEKPIVVVIPSYNNKDWYERNLSSLFAQKYRNYRVIYVDDCSSDGTGELVEKYVNEHGMQDRVTVIKNPERRGALANLYYAIHSCADHEIVATYDGDDFMKTDQALARINQAYQNKHTLMTYGQFETFPEGQRGFCAPMPDMVTGRAAYRKYQWVSSHMRTFYAGLFKKIEKEDLMRDGDFFDVTWDMAMMFPMLEMAAGRCEFISDVLYVYNQANVLNDFKQKLPRVLECERIIRNKSPYDPLPADAFNVTA